MRVLTWLRGIFDLSWLLGPVDPEAGYVLDVDALFAGRAHLSGVELGLLRENGPVRFWVEDHEYEMLPAEFAIAIYRVIGARGRKQILCPRQGPLKGRLLGDYDRITLRGGEVFSLVPI